MVMVWLLVVTAALVVAVAVAVGWWRQPVGTHESHVRVRPGAAVTAPPARVPVASAGMWALRAFAQYLRGTNPADVLMPSIVSCAQKITKDCSVLPSKALAWPAAAIVDIDDNVLAAVRSFDSPTDTTVDHTDGAPGAAQVAAGGGLGDVGPGVVMPGAGTAMFLREVQHLVRETLPEEFAPLPGVPERLILRGGAPLGTVAVTVTRMGTLEPEAATSTTVPAGTTARRPSPSHASEDRSPTAEASPEHGRYRAPAAAGAVPVADIDGERLSDTGVLPVVPPADAGGRGGAAHAGVGDLQDAAGTVASPQHTRAPQVPGTGAVLVKLRDRHGRHHPVFGGCEVLLGRDVTCDVRFASTGVSSRHAVVRATPALGVTVEDLGSTNGTSLNGVACLPGQEYPLQVGDVLGLAGVAFLAVDPRTARTSPVGSPGSAAAAASA